MHQASDRQSMYTINHPMSVKDLESAVDLGLCNADETPVQGGCLSSMYASMTYGNITIEGVLLNPLLSRKHVQLLDIPSDDVKQENSQFKRFSQSAEQRYSNKRDDTYVTPPATPSPSEAREYSLMSPRVSFIWTPDHSAAFSKVKQTFAQPTVLAHVDPAFNTVLQIDASLLHGIGYALLQEHSEGMWRLVQCRLWFPIQNPGIV